MDEKIIFDSYSDLLKCTNYSMAPIITARDTDHLSLYRNEQAQNALYDMLGRGLVTCRSSLYFNNSMRRDKTE